MLCPQKISGAGLANWHASPHPVPSSPCLDQYHLHHYLSQEPRRIELWNYASRPARHFAIQWCQWNYPRSDYCQQETTNLSPRNRLWYLLFHRDRDRRQHSRPFLKWGISTSIHARLLQWGTVRRYNGSRMRRLCRLLLCCSVHPKPAVIGFRLAQRKWPQLFFFCWWNEMLLLPWCKKKKMEQEKPQTVYLASCRNGIFLDSTKVNEYRVFDYMQSSASNIL